MKKIFIGLFLASIISVDAFSMAGSRSPRVQERRLWAAVESGDLEGVKEVLHEGIDEVKKRTSQHGTILHLAARHAEEEAAVNRVRRSIFEYLLAYRIADSSEVDR